MLVVWKLERLSRSLKDVLTLKETVEKAGAGFLSLTEAVDTASPAERMMMQIVGSFAEFQRPMIHEHTRSGLLAARREGHIGGRRPKLTPTQQKGIVHLVDSGQKTAADSQRLFNVHLSKVARLLICSKLST
ncbi:recombinase family protein [Janthinobacterium sp. Ant5-2-1]|uniref:recombinase family protein n=1 Tax=Janthinobacterium sp. Ant5-2-1 TaxID=1755239 RepID=UPI000B27368E|nr:recombinase family protein [Janthinobacterium sp. Ant5-2-1]